MAITEFTFRLVVLFIPGLTSFLIIDKLTNHKNFKFYEVLVYTLLLGFLNYMAIYGIITSLGCYFEKLNGYEFYFLKALKNTQFDLSFTELLWATIISLPFGIFISVVINKNWLFTLAQRWKISNKFGNIDVWDYVLNKDAKGFEWIVVRDIKNDLMYEGRTESFSDSAEKKEIFLRDVAIYKNSSGDFLYSVPGVYLNVSEAVLEFTALEFTKFKFNPEAMDKKVEN